TDTLSWTPGVVAALDLENRKNSTAPLTAMKQTIPTIILHLFKPDLSVANAMELSDGSHPCYTTLKRSVSVFKKLTNFDILAGNYLRRGLFRIRIPSTILNCIIYLKHQERFGVGKSPITTM